jgi:hypothetical protein
MRWTLSSDEAVLGKVTAERVDDLRTLSHQQVPCSKHNGACLSILALHSNKTHRRALRGLANRLGLGRVVLLSLHEGLNVGRWDQSHSVAEFADLAQ